MKFFLDTEFYEDGSTIDLISIGVVSETGRELYAVNTDAKLHLVSPWVRTHVLPSLPPYASPGWMPAIAIRNVLEGFVKTCWDDTKVEFWAYYGAYDWVAVCQLFGTMMGLPKFFPRWVRELKQLAADVGDPELPRNALEHNALDDARWNRDVYRFLMEKKAAARR